MNKKMKIIVITVLAIVAASPIIGYILAKKSDPYQFTVDKIKKSNVLIEKLGDIKKIELKPFGYSVKYRGPNGKADFEIKIIGEKNNGVLFIALQTNLGVWEIIGAKLDGDPLNLK